MDPVQPSFPRRPTLATEADPTQCGVVELAYGFEREWGDGSHDSDVSGGVTFGITPNLDLQWTAGDYMEVGADGDDYRGYGDNTFALRYRLRPQKKHSPSLGVMYTVKLPTADPSFGLGSGEMDHSISFLASKDVRALHIDFNVISEFIGRPGSSDFDRNTGFTLATWLPVTKRVTLVAEPYGFTSLNDGMPAFASLMTGCVIRLRPRLHLDAGIDFPLHAISHEKRVYVGFTYTITNVYRLLHEETW